MEHPLTDNWFVLRDLTRPNAKRPAYRLLEEKGIEVFTPMRWQLVERKGKRIREEVPLLHDLTPAMYGRMIRIEGGPLDGYEGRLLSIRGARVKRLIVEIPGLLVAAVEVDPEYIRLL